MPGIFTVNQPGYPNIGIPASESVRYYWSQISPALPNELYNLSLSQSDVSPRFHFMTEVPCNIHPCVISPVPEWLFNYIYDLKGTQAWGIFSWFLALYNTERLEYETYVKQIWSSHAIQIFNASVLTQ